MRFKGDIQKMNTAPVDRVPGTDGLFYLDIYYSESTSSINDWKYLERAAANVTYDEALDIERKRIDELKEQYNS